MRFKINLSLLQDPEKQNILPVNYQNDLYNCITGILDSGEASYKQWLSANGFLMGSQYFRNFTFSTFNITEEMHTRVEDSLVLKCSELSFDLSFLTDPAAEEHILNIFKGQSFSISAKKGKAQFTVKSIEKVDLPEIKDSICIRAISPIVISKISKASAKPGAKAPSIEYLEPGTNEYKLLFLQSLTKKFIAINKGKSIGNIDNFKLELLSTPKSKVVKIKDEKGNELKVKGAIYDFKITTSPILIKVGLDGGFGEDTNHGFGYSEIIN